MQIRIELFSLAREVIGEPQLMVEVPEGSTVLQLISHLAEQKGEKFARLIRKPDGSFSSSIAIALNDQQISLTDPIPLSEGDEISILPAISGG
jgi:molybdopterin synthase sulfur carrier subunit